MKLITTNEQLTALLPNIAVTVQGEVPLFDKLSPFLAATEKWLIEEFTSDRTFNTICGYVDDNPTKVLATQIVAYEAFRRALPHLDVILTPNGFGIVSNQNIAPASRDRVDRLIGSIEMQRDDAIILLQKALFKRTDWQRSEVFGYWAQTLLPNISVCHQLQICEHRFVAYRALVPRIIQIEDELANSFISPELLTHLHTYQFGIGYAELSPAEQSGRAYVLTHLTAEIVSQLNGNPIRHRYMSDLVNVIRSQTDIFPQWHSSDTAKLFEPPIFENKKEAQGYFF